MSLTVVDDGSLQTSGTLLIHVTVLDANDNTPIFTQELYKIGFSVNSSLNTLVVRVSATDADEGVNGEVTYDFGCTLESNETFN